MIETTSVTVGIPVGDPDEAVSWYGKLLDAAPDIEPVEGILEFEVRPGFWLQIAEGNRGSGDAVIRLGVRDLDAALARLHTIGIETGDIQRIPGVIMFSDFSDPWDNDLGLYQVL